MALYEKLEYELELITPAFIGGAFPKEQAELRPASFIGILRWWFRNLALTFTDDLNEIYNLESELFGNTQRAGKVWVRFGDIPKEKYKQFEVPQNVDISILTYLGYGNFTYVNCEKPKSKSEYQHICQKLPFFKGNINVRAFIPAGEKVKLTLLVPKKYKNLLENLLFIVSQLGALGGRNRRGWGNFYLNSLNGKKESWKSCKVERAYDNFISELCKFIPRGNSAQSIRIYEKNCEKSNPLEVLNLVGLNYKNFRNKKPAKFSKVKFFLQRKPYLIYNYAWLGLPIQVKPKLKKINKNKNLNKKNREVVEINLFNKNESKRLASPILFRVFRNATSRFELLLIVFDKRRFYKKEEGYYHWNFSNAKVKAKLVRKLNKKKQILAEKPVVMSQSFENFVCNFLQEIKVSTQPVLTLGG